MKGKHCVLSKRFYFLELMQERSIFERSFRISLYGVQPSIDKIVETVGCVCGLWSTENEIFHTMRPEILGKKR